MKGTSLTGIVTGMLLGAAAATAVSKMNWQGNGKIRKFAESSGQKLAEKTGELLGK